MAQGFQRHQRVAGQIKREIAELIRDSGVDGGANAPLTMLTITDCEVSRDLAHAKIFYSVLNADEQPIAEQWLDEAAGYLRSELGHRMRLRIVPQLTFVFDNSIEQGMQMDALIRAVREQDGDVDEDSESDDSSDPR
ncbi:30S ribosome-binding factor RbfA [Guyparkeria hydrothermalis]|uniref:30S ribosome-binding factor RbfA n=1 Tax=Guyparkeria hydrothermalis TaxID=923 RepID=UPI00201FE980|nr:30S ribosome-binding factor RbfA [Guyparkeria hydrothermalis]MCL7743375.1 30S ribosome-binding factor RbfA [Guyparkeria hydrothermalis]